MRVLITGITGFVGSHLADYILADCPFCQISAITRWRGSEENIKHMIDRVTLYNADLRDLSSIIQVLNESKPDLIFHLAAENSHVAASYTAPAETIFSNVIGCVNLLEGIRLTHVDPITLICSTSEVYGQVRPDEIPIKETTLLRPQNPYGVSKAAEDLLSWQYFISYGIKIIRTRGFTQSGPRKSAVYADSSFAKQIAAIEIGKQEPTIGVGNLDSIRNFTDVRDMARAYWLLVQGCLSGEVPLGEVYNIGSERSIKIGDALKYLLDLSPVKDKIVVKVDETRLRRADISAQIPCVDKFRQVVDWQAGIPLETTLEDLLQYWREKISDR